MQVVAVVVVAASEAAVAPSGEWYFIMYSWNEVHR